MLVSFLSCVAPLFEYVIKWFCQIVEKCLVLACGMLVENIHITTTFELPTEKVVANMLATEESVCFWRAEDRQSLKAGQSLREDAILAARCRSKISGM